MATVNIAITATLSQLGTFADELGYQAFILDPQSPGESNVIPNTEARKAFLQAYFKGLVVSELSKIRVKSIDQQIKDQRETEKQAFRDAVSNAVEVTFKA